MRTGGVSKSRIGLQRCVQICHSMISNSRLARFTPWLNKHSAFMNRKKHSLSKPQFNPQTLNCRAEVQNLNGKIYLDIRIRGKITVDEPGRQIKLQILFLDITNDINSPQPVYKAKQPDFPVNQKPFEHICELGKVPELSMEVSEWTSVAQINSQWLMTPRSGRRRIYMEILLLCCENSEHLTTAQNWFEFDASQPGYLDIQENFERAKALGVTLAFAVSSADSKIYKSEIECIKQWAKSNIYGDPDNCTNNRKLEKAFNKTVKFFKKGKKVDITRLCMELVQNAPLAYRYDVLALCLCAVETKGIITAAQLKMLKDVALRLEVDMEKFRSMFEQLAPVATHQVKDMELLFGINSQMSKDQRLEKLNQEYRKWNARVTSPDRSVRNQAELMLDLIAQTRGKYTS